jgi:hypothetical protein
LKIHTVVPIFPVLTKFQPKQAQLNFFKIFAELSDQKWSNFAWNGQISPKLAKNLPVLGKKVSQFLDGIQQSGFRLKFDHNWQIGITIQRRIQTAKSCFGLC